MKYPFATSVLVAWAGAAVGLLLRAEPVVFVAYGIVNPGLIIAFSQMIRHPKLKPYYSDAWKKIANQWLVIILLLNIPGSVYLHSLGIQYDRFLHYTAAFAALIAILIFFSPIMALRFGTRHLNMWSMLRFAIVATFVGLFLWEGLQWSIDQVFGTQLFHDAVQPITQDATEDVLFGFLGMLTASFYVAKSKRFWKTLQASLE